MRAGRPFTHENSWQAAFVPTTAIFLTFFTAKSRDWPCCFCLFGSCILHSFFISNRMWMWPLRTLWNSEPLGNLGETSVIPLGLFWLAIFYKGLNKGLKISVLMKVCCGFWARLILICDLIPGIEDKSDVLWKHVGWTEVYISII